VGLEPKNQLNTAKFALVIAEYSKNIHDAPDTLKWQEFLGTATLPFPTTEHSARIHENIWLIPLHSEMPFLSALFLRAHEKGIPLRVLFLDEPPDWIKYPPDAQKSDGGGSQATA
jgi:hypothetical protein